MDKDRVQGAFEQGKGAEKEGAGKIMGKHTLRGAELVVDGRGLVVAGPQVVR